MICFYLLIAVDISAECPCAADVKGNRINLVKQPLRDSAFSGAVDSTAGTYFNAWVNEQYVSARRKLRGALFGAAGNRKSALILFEDGSFKSPGTAVIMSGPIVAYNSSRPGFFLTWMVLAISDTEKNTYEIRGQFVSSDGTISGPKLNLAQLPGFSGGEISPGLISLIYNQINNEFLIAYEINKYDFSEDEFVENDLMLLRVDGNGNPIGEPVLAIRLDSFHNARVKFDSINNRYMILLTTNIISGFGKVAFKVYNADLTKLTNLKVLASGKLENELVSAWLVYSARQQTFFVLLQFNDTSDNKDNYITRVRAIRPDGKLSVGSAELPLNLGVLDIRTNPETGGFVILHSSKESIELLHLNDQFSVLSNVLVDCVYARHHEPKMIYNPVAREILVSWGAQGINRPPDSTNIVGRRFTAIPSGRCNQQSL